MFARTPKSALTAMRHDLAAHPSLRLTLMAIGATGALCWGSFIFGRCTESRPVKAPHLQLSGTVIGESSSLAVINGRPLHLSDGLTADEQIYRVVGIRPGRVLLLRSNGTTLDLPIDTGYALPAEDEARASLAPFEQHAQHSRL